MTNTPWDLGRLALGHGISWNASAPVQTKMTFSQLSRVGASLIQNHEETRPGAACRFEAHLVCYASKKRFTKRSVEPKGTPDHSSIAEY